MRVTVAFALPGLQEVLEVEVPEGATVGEAIGAAPLAERFPGIEFTALDAGLGGVRAARETRLRAGDRVELYRPLEADPKEMRRRRVKARTSPRSRNGP